MKSDPHRHEPQALRERLLDHPATFPLAYSETAIAAAFGKAATSHS